LITIASQVGVLTLEEFVSDEPYQFYREGWDVSDGRSITGSIRIKGNAYTPKRRWEFGYKVPRGEIDLFESIYATQHSQLVALTDGYAAPPITVIVVLDIDGKYATRLAGDWWLLQFSAREE
jgi:hypothetical protein